MATTLTQTPHLSITQRRYTVGYIPNRGDTSTPLLNLSGKWLKEAGFDTGTGVTVKITEGCIVLIPDNDEVKELREQLKQVKQAVKVMNQGLAETV
ncbi:type I addiction module toxin, SymE family [Budviciaceae bacterium BWR-B9]|uniref:Type I addiction module toxin, SymE family n=1 Tax=Limnobaculum allomyrinae TaxID=2791986 RepID=A0ABS1IRL9_9GAMM|nr:MULTISPECIES: SymE family type I addiction module toxin [Limnobaculum]MBK5144384.1 type I addiction module toxin, SymE family [Limnobaculum allomyrinae]MBV7691871.1 SymE family type I addiction module toxin [Limnobaculum sp. M2-1]